MVHATTRIWFVLADSNAVAFTRKRGTWAIIFSALHAAYGRDDIGSKYDSNRLTHTDSKKLM